MASKYLQICGTAYYNMMCNKRFGMNKILFKTFNSMIKSLPLFCLIGQLALNISYKYELPVFEPS